MPKIRYETPPWLARWEDAVDKQPDCCFTLNLLPDRAQRTMETIFQADEIFQEYEDQGFELTLRQLYYQFVARDMLANTDKNYKKLGTTISNGRLWGFLDWNLMVDRGRNFESRVHWEDPERIIKACVDSFAVDRWRDCDHRFEVWVEKQALEDIVARACRPFDVGYIACKGYMSQSEMWAAAQRLRKYEAKGQQITILHLGDHDPSGMDMSRDIQDRLAMFRCGAYVDRIALNMDQVEQYTPPPNPAKVTDTRAGKYIAEFGDESWELDALEPKVLIDLIQGELSKVIDVDPSYEVRESDEYKGKELLGDASSRWPEVTKFLNK